MCIFFSRVMNAYVRRSSYDAAQFRWNVENYVEGSTTVEVRAWRLCSSSCVRASADVCVEWPSNKTTFLTWQVVDKNQSVYIYGCGATVIDVRGKGKSVILDNCKRTQASLSALLIIYVYILRQPYVAHMYHHRHYRQVLVDDLLSSLEVVNCQRVKVQVKSKAPTVAIDKTDGIVVILPQGSLNTSFITSKSSEM